MATITINSVQNYIGTPLEKAFAPQRESITPELMKSRVAANLEAGKISQEEHDNALEVIEKITAKK